MNSKKIITAAALLVACPLVLHAQAPPLTAPAAPTAPVSPTTPAASAVTLRYKFAVGQVHLYQYNTETDVMMQTGQTGAGIPISMTTQTTMRQTVKSIRPADGAATIITQIGSVRALRNGQEVPMSEEQQAKMKQPFTQVMLPNGEILSVKVAVSSAGTLGMDFSKGASGSLGSTVALPGGKTKIGDTWNTIGTVPGIGVDLTSKSVLASLDQKNGATLATIQTTQTGIIDKPLTVGMPMKMQGKVSGDMSQVFDMSEGALQSMKGTMSANMLMTSGTAASGAAPGMPSAMKMQVQVKYTMELLTGQSVVVPNGPAAAPAQ